MIIDAIRKLYEVDAAKRVGRGNPTGSRFGSCAAQGQMLRYPKGFPSVPPRARNVITWEEGDRVEAWFSEVIERAFPNRSGLAQEPFYFPVPIERGDVDILTERIRAPYDAPHRLWGAIEPGFVPPSITPTADGRAKLHLLPRDQTKPNAAFFKGYEPLRLGFVLDPDALIIYAPSYIDRVINHPDIGLCVLEKKSMSNATFRRALIGNLGYGMRCQLAGMVAATGLPAAWLCYRKETGHLCEILYTPKAEQVRIEITKLNGQTEVFFVDSAAGDWQSGDEGLLETVDDDAPTGWAPYGDVVVHREGSTDVAKIPGDAEWDEAQTWTPYDKHLLDQIRARVRRVLLFAGEREQLYREYGPSFVCRVCDGTTVQRRAKNGRKMLKTPKPCVDCTAGFVAEVELTFPCTYCAVVKECWKDAGVRLELDSRPHYYVSRSGFETSRLAFHPPDERPALPAGGTGPERTSPERTSPSKASLAAEPCSACGGTGTITSGGQTVVCVICTEDKPRPKPDPRAPVQKKLHEQPPPTAATTSAPDLREELTGKPRSLQQRLVEDW